MASKIKANQYGLYAGENGRHIVKAIFRGKLEIVFEGISHKECMAYCHRNGVRMMDEQAFMNRVNPWFVKKNAAKPFRAEDYQVAVIF